MIGKILGGGIAFLLGANPIGILLGVALGHLIDKDNQTTVISRACQNCNTFLNGNEEYCPGCGAALKSNYSKTEQQQAAFVTVLIVLCAKMAQVDGKIDAAEARIVKKFFKEKLNADDRSLEQVKNIFKEALNSQYRLEDILVQWNTLANPQLNYMLLDLLYQIAMADGMMHSTEEKFINQIVSQLGISETIHKQIRGAYISSINQYYEILGVSPNADNQEIKKAYRNLVTQYHPDKLISKGLPEDMIKFAQEKMNKINEAYEEIRKARKF
ncbi:MAG TPA: TerB family tellurite resistance protein [bacterium]|nr:TerB family tellurite resistance protein [bacterium]